MEYGTGTHYLVGGCLILVKRTHKINAFSRLTAGNPLFSIHSKIGWVLLASSEPEVADELTVIALLSPTDREWNELRRARPLQCRINSLNRTSRSKLMHQESAIRRFREHVHFRLQYHRVHTFSAASPPRIQKKYPVQY